jgi:hypothetical protein
MDVRILQTLPFNITDTKDLVKKILTEGTVTTGFPNTVNSINVDGLYFIAGGRKSISNVLNATPNLAFTAETIGAKMTRVKTQHKHFAIVGIYPSTYIAKFAYSAGHWSSLIQPLRGQITCFQLVNAMWDAEAKIAMGIAQSAFGK